MLFVCVRAAVLCAGLCMFFSPPARRGSLDFNRGAGPSPSSPSSPSPACLPLCQLRMLPCLDADCRSQAPVDVDCAWTRSPYRELRRLWSVLGPDRHIASSGGCDHHIASAGSCVELDFWPTWFSIFDAKIRDCEAIEEPPNVVTSPCHASCPLTCRTSVPFCLD